MNEKFITMICVSFFLFCLLASIAYSLRESWYRKNSFWDKIWRAVIFVLCSLVIVFAFPVLFVGALVIVAAISMSISHLILNNPLDYDLIHAAIGVIVFDLLIIPAIFGMEWLEKSSDDYRKRN